jgi:hypothetical protein
MSDDTGSEPMPTAPASAPAQPRENKTGAGKIVIVIIIAAILILAVLLIALSGGDSEDDDNDDGENGKNGKKDQEGIKYITAIGGLSQADAAAKTWDASAKLQHVRGFEGPSYKIDREEWDWVSDYGIPTEKEERFGDGRCMVWEYEYFPEDGDLFHRFHVLVFGNSTVLTWEEQATGSVNTDTLSDWSLDSTGVTDIAKTLGLFNNITERDSAMTYVYYELWPYYWELNCDDGIDYIRIQVDERAGEIIYHNP